MGEHDAFVSESCYNCMFPSTGHHRYVDLVKHGMGLQFLHCVEVEAQGAKVVKMGLGRVLVVQV